MSRLNKMELMRKIDLYRDVEPSHFMRFDCLANARLYQRGLRFRFTGVDLVDSRPNKGPLDDEWIQYIQQAPFTNNTLSQLFGISVHMVRKYKRANPNDVDPSTLPPTEDPTPQ